MNKNYILNLLAIFVCFCSLIKAQPVITSFSPSSGPVGSTVTITGTNFNTLAANNSVFFGATKAIVSTATTSTLTVIVPGGATYQPISITDLNTHLTAYTTAPFVPTFSCGGFFNTQSFATKIDSATAKWPHSSWAGDVDGDGKTDIAVANSNDNTISVFRNNSTPGFISLAPKINFTADKAPLNGVFQELDGDGRLDLVVVNRGTNTISVFLNSSVPGSISFMSKIDYATGTSPEQVLVTDIDGDGKPDIIVSNRSSKTISVFKNTCTPGINSFLAKLDFATDLYPNAISSGDLDGDHKPDLAITSSTGFCVLQNTSTSGNISFSNLLSFPLGLNNAGISGVVIGDLDGDNLPDVSLSTTNVSAQGYISIYRNTSTNGIISFAARVDKSLAFSIASIAIADIDGDGKVDIGVTAESGFPIWLFKNLSTTGTISFGNGVSLGSIGTASALRIGDLDGDDKPDLFIANNTTSQLSLFRNLIFVGPVVTTVVNLTPKCSGVNFVAPLTSNIPSTFSWVAIDNPRVTGETTTIQTSTTINNTLVNISDSFQVVKYKVIPTSIDGHCTGATNELTVTIYPVPKMLSTDTDIVPDGGAVNIGFASNVKCTYKWKATDNPNVSGESIKERNTSYIEDTLTLLSNTRQIVSYTVTPFSVDGCGAGSPQPITVAVNIIPVITSFSPHSGPVGSTVTIQGTHFNPVTTNNIVFFGAVQATVLTASETLLTVVVPYGSTHQVISVTDAATGLAAYTIEPFVPTFPNCRGIYDESFGVKTESLGFSPYMMATGDLNGDGKPDMIVSKNGGSPTLSIFLNTSTGSTISFAFQQSIPIVYSANAGLALADLDGDGKQDIVMLNFNVTILRNTSSGGVISFSKPIDYSVGIAYAETMTIGDLNRDGKPEIIVVYRDSREYGVFNNKSTVGTISFRGGQSTTLNSGRSCGVTLGDINSDGWPDLVVTDQSSLRVNIFINRCEYGRAIFDPYTFPGNTDLFGLAMGDLDGDGKSDIITANKSSGYISIYKNSTISINNPTYDTILFYKTEKNPLRVLLNDLDGDGKLDIAVLNSGSDNISLFKNKSINGTISFENKVNFATGKNPVAMIIEDLNGDTKPDLVSTNSISENLTFLKNRMDTVPVMTSRNVDTIPSSGTIVFQLKSTSPSSYTWIANDNPNVTGESTTLQTTDTLKNFLRNNTNLVQTVIYTVIPTSKMGCGTGYPQTVLIKVFPEAPAVLSFSPTSGPAGTLVTITGTTFNSTPGNNFVFFGTAAAEVVSASPTSLVVIAPAGATLQTISVLDVVTGLTGYSSKPFYILSTCTEAVNSQSFIQVKRLPLDVPRDYEYVSLGDLDGDGKLDLVVTQTVNHNVSILRNNSDNGIISFEPVLNFGWEGMASGIVIRDLDGDGKPEVVATSLNVMVDAGFFILKNTSTKGTLSFEPKIAYRLGDWHQRIVVEDLDKDGKPEIITVDYYSDKMSILKNKSLKGTISFVPAIDSIIGTDAFDLACGDLNDDDKPEILISGGNDNKFYVLPNNSSIGSLHFLPKIAFQAYSPDYIATNDFDGDGKLDVITATFSATNDVSIHRNNSSGGMISFEPKVDISSPAIANYHGLMTIGDLDGDNKAEIIFAGGVYVWKNTSSPGTISFAPGVFLTSGGNCISVGDLDLDGKPDMVLGYNYSDSIAILKNVMCAPVTIIENGDSFLIDIYPNPFTSQTNITFNKPIKNATIQLIDMYGKEIRRIDFTGNKLILERENLSPGIYFIKISSSSDIIINRKIIIQ